MSTVKHVVGINVLNQITIDNDPDHHDMENRNHQNQIIWRADNITVRRFRIVFASSPFRYGVTTITGDASGSSPDTFIAPDATLGDHKYTVGVEAVSGKNPDPSDPHIIVSDTGPTAGGDDPDRLKSIGSDMIDAVATVLAKHMNDVATNGERFFFPFGIQSITVGALGVTVTVSGETPPPNPPAKP